MLLRSVFIATFLPLGIAAETMTARADTSATSKTKAIEAVWLVDAQNPASLEIDVTPHLSERQRNLIQSGFTTFSLLEVRTSVPDAKTGDPEPVFKLACTVRYDTWNERYDVAHLTEQPQNRLVKNFDRYSQLCLTAHIRQADLVAPWREKGQRLHVTLLVDQISISKADEIKQWLIRQQSGVMQGIFAHMLGELKLTERVDAPVNVPPLKTAPKAPPAVLPGKRWSMLGRHNA